MATDGERVVIEPMRQRGHQQSSLGGATYIRVRCRIYINLDNHVPAMYPNVEPNAGVRGHDCHGRSQSSAAGIAPIQAPTSVPIRGCTSDRSICDSGLKSQTSLVSRYLCAMPLSSSCGTPKAKRRGIAERQAMCVASRRVALVVNVRIGPHTTYISIGAPSVIDVTSKTPAMPAVYAVIFAHLSSCLLSWG